MIKDYRNIDFTTEKRVVKVGIIDGKIDNNHKAFQEIYSIKEKQFSDIIYDEDIIHGTSVLGVIGAGYGVGIANPKFLEIISASVLSNGTTSSEQLKNAIIWCIKEKVEVVNISLSFTVFSEELVKLMSNREARKILFIFSNGNFETKKRILPAMNNVIFVGALDNFGEKSTINSTSKADIYTQGVNILTTTEKNSFSKMKGTTYSTAVITGLVSRKLQSFKNKKDNQVQLLKQFIFSESITE
ncbi:hypothetical protein DBN64_09085 [Enterococcus faecalis]|uniref:Peptidase, S8/S53 family n=12 Tax=Enterococcus faecalis TaxID=1351 RepID=A0ABC9P560_ENTFL|nr:S8/S53 family peptidase [Enterococcus faecalis]EEU16333.1 predicted protein [Enterococcus faecalis ATCC 4200]EEU84502.1 predicted protein [Enterococcus faecalis CH188]EFU90158.1 peptidase, S8/S53 family [Enterococcus faecalis TX0630]EOI98017.1 hypothetical protein UMC_00785 [Enterococcus faecalis EnGen0302]EOJ05699.1 hypothetical protein UME_00750 [Enterococcus faecalis EnGen0306]EOL63374.1 hypothetical protein UCS_00761 [Enterococcus faecalis EnGen0246]EOL66942.1 hypothetical protein UCU